MLGNEHLEELQQLRYILRIKSRFMLRTVCGAGLLTWSWRLALTAGV